MPYIITTTAGTPINTDEISDRPYVARRAVATLDGARDYAWAQAGWTPDAPESIHDLRRAHDGLQAESGGTIGPLPDGTVIEVLHRPLSSPFADAQTWCDIYNAARGA